MTAMAATINSMLDTLEDEDYNAAISYIEFLSEKRKKENSKVSKDAMKEIQGMFKEDKGWNSEEDMLKDMAEFRRKRQNV